MLDGWRPGRHDNSGGDLELASRVCNPLGVVTYAGSARTLGSIGIFSITSRTGHNALPAIFGVHVRHLIIGSPKLETEDRLKVLALQQDLAFESVA